MAAAAGMTGAAGVAPAAAMVPLAAGGSGLQLQEGLGEAPGPHGQVRALALVVLAPQHAGGRSTPGPLRFRLSEGAAPATLGPPARLRLTLPVQSHLLHRWAHLQRLQRRSALLPRPPGA
jgi:hypothetical protein